MKRLLFWQSLVLVLGTTFGILNDHAFSQTSVVRELSDKAQSKKDSGDFFGAYQLAIEADSLLQANPGSADSLRASVKYLIGILLYNLGDYQAAIDTLHSAIDLYVKDDNPGGQADCYFNIANSVWYIEGAASALKEFETAIHYAALDFKGTRVHRGKYQIYKGYALCEMSQFAEGLPWVTKGIEEDRQYFRPASKQYAEGLMILGVVRNYQGDYFKAAVALREAIQILEKQPVQSDLEQAPVYGNLANVFFKMGDLEEAERYYLKSFAVYKRMLEPDNPVFALVYMNLVTVCLNQNKPKEALEWQQKAVPLIDPNNTSLVLPSQLGAAMCLHNLGQYAAADSIQRQIKEPIKAFFGDGDVNLAVFYENRGDNLALMDSLEASIQAFDQAGAIYRSVYPAGHVSEAQIACRKAETYRLGYQFEQAIEWCDRGLEIFAANPEELPLLQRDVFFSLQDIRASSYGQLAKSGERQGLQEAVSSYHAMEALSDRIMAEERSMESKAAFQSGNAATPGKLLSVYARLFALGDSTSEAMWQISEKSKSFLLLDGIRRTQVPIVETVMDSVRRVTAAANFYRKKIFDAQQQPGTASEAEVIQWQETAFELEKHRRDLWGSFQKDAPDLSGYFSDVAYLSMKKVPESLLKGNQALLEYFVADSNIFIFVVRPDTIVIHTVKRDFPLEDWIEQFRHGLYGYYTAKIADQTDALYEQCLDQYLEYAPKLYQKLFAPVQEWLPAQYSIVIVPDGPLGYIPFDALLTGAPRDVNNFKKYPFLLHKYQFSYTYSATLLQEMRDKKHRREPSTMFGAFAPFYAGDSLFVSGRNMASGNRKGFNPLPFSKLEVDKLRQLMGGDLATGAYATKAQFLATAGNYRILHLATHGVADNRVGDYSFLVFSGAKDSLGEVLLYVKDLYNLELNADLVVLSACETGTGALQRGEGIISLARAFAYAGAKSIITSLWSVNDQSTSELMGHFYAALKAGEAKDQALKSAREAYLKGAPVTACHPFFWAAFVPVGDMRAVR